MADSFEELKPMVRPEGVHFGEMLFDTEKCISCGLCIKNCVFACLEIDDEEHARMKKAHNCFSCFNCMVSCPADAISIGSSYHVDYGFFDLDFPVLKMPLPPQDAEGNPVERTAVEQTIMNRRS
ncbi:MAG TPA: hypothetical protein HA232_05290, partial [Methanocellales archaeon]|nr:hypothetical protein [Methanocellales archaeon]